MQINIHIINSNINSSSAHFSTQINQQHKQTWIMYACMYVYMLYVEMFVMLT